MDPSWDDAGYVDDSAGTSTSGLDRPAATCSGETASGQPVPVPLQAKSDQPDMFRPDLFWPIPL